MINIAENLRDLTDSATYNFHESFDLEENVHPQVTISVVYTGECSQSQYFINWINIAPGEEKNKTKQTHQ